MGLQNKYNSLSSEHDDLKKELEDTRALVKRLESCIDSHIANYKKDKKASAAPKGEATDNSKK